MLFTSRFSPLNALFRRYFYRYFVSRSSYAPALTALLLHFCSMSACFTVRVSYNGGDDRCSSAPGLSPRCCWYRNLSTRLEAHPPFYFRLASDSKKKPLPSRPTEITILLLLVNLCHLSSLPRASSSSCSCAALSKGSHTPLAFFSYSFAHSVLHTAKLVTATIKGSAAYAQQAESPVSSLRANVRLCGKILSSLQNMH